jgi:hypothetical protein
MTGVLLLFLCASAQAATVPAASCSRTDVGNAVTAAASGDTVSVPAGTCTWSSTLTINKSLILLGAGVGATKIVSGAVSPLIEIALSADVPVRVSGFSFDNVNYPGGDKVSIHIGWNMNSGFGIKQLRIDHNAFNKGKQCIMTDGSRIYGVIDHNDFLNCDAAIGANGDIRTWEDPIAPGTANALFIEDNTFRADNNAAGWSEQEQIMHGHGNRTVIRYNTFDLRAYTIGNGLPIEAHGNGNCYTGSSNDLRGMPILEIYNNTMRVHASYRFINIRGGSDLVHDNTLTSEIGNPAAIEFKEEEGNGAEPFTGCKKTAWSAEDQINNSFVWNNTLNGQAVTDIDLDYATDPVFIQQGRDYFMHAPAVTGGKETYTGRPGGPMSFSAAGANAYYLYTPFTYPHPLVSASSLPPANTFYIRDGGTSTACTDWAQACDTLPATLQRGATYYVARGNYGSYTFDDPESGGKLIVIKKATESDHGTDTGWNAGYGDGQAIFNSVLTFTRGDYVFDGQVRDETNWFAGAAYGFQVANNNQDQNIVIGTQTRAVNNVVIRYVYVNALVGNLGATTLRRYAIDTDTYGGPIQTGLVFHRMFINGSNNVWFLRTTNGAVVEYSASDNVTGNDANHGEIVNLYYSGTNATIRYNVFRNAYTGAGGVPAGGGTALVAITDANGLQFYGNTAYNFNVGDGAVGYLGGNASHCRLYNNTFVSGIGYNAGFASDGADNVTNNNLWVGNSAGVNVSGTHDYNAYSDGNVRGESHAQISVPTSIFVNYGARDLRLAAPTNSGNTLSSSYDRDAAGITRGADGVWDRGAYEFVSGAASSACDLNGDSATNVSDVQTCVNQAIGVAACGTGDINKDGSCNVVDVQRDVNAALGGQCVTQ